MGVLLLRQRRSGAGGRRQLNRLGPRLSKNESETERRGQRSRAWEPPRFWIRPSFDAVSAAPDSGYAADSADAFAIAAQSEEGWYIYTGPPTHWILPIEDRVFVVKAADGTYAKIQFTGYYKDNENKTDSGHVSFKYVHQPDGSLNF